ncbi:PD-(D/E)XK nuclease family protein [Alicyclobacillus dauci]|uniref:PD-(D/E)XK nuclease family protein n=1 Tax=Alicyclobacillus dauci TaxID=1475485 RepID=A0ABY6Z8E3_9BACL|nr:PD-(D/E)XK nuclease family protein [Alicyclobacillus dauci]WAH39165.1 PD-(D/E)XK nuclease family protein [Alicyclobacillus dauci]
MRVWLGNTRTGKSTRVVEEIRETTAREPIGAPIYWVVPDDVAFAAEQMLMSDMASVLRPEVITLRRLAERIRESTGSSRFQAINATGKQLLFASVYQELRDSLGPLKRVQANSGFYQMVLDAFDEMSRHEVDLAALQGALEAASASLENDVPRAQAFAGRSLLGKLRDLCVLYVRYRGLLEERGFFDPAMALSQATSAVSSAVHMADVELYVDGFTELTPQEINFLCELSRHTRRCTFIFTVPDEHVLHAEEANRTVPDYWPHIDPLGELIPKLTDAGYGHALGASYAVLTLVRALDQNGQAPSFETFTDDGRLSRTAFADIERTLRELPIGKPSAWDKQVRFWEAEDDESEATAVAASIVRLVEDGRARYNEVVVVVPSIQEDGPRLQEAFRRYGIPHAIDTFPPLAAHPLGRFLLAAMQVVLTDLSVDAMARYLRTDYCGISDTDADWLDIYLRTHNVAGSDLWFSEEPWTFEAAGRDDRHRSGPAPGDTRADTLRAKIRASLEPFYGQFGSVIVTPVQLAHAVWSLLESVDVKDRVAMQVVNEDAESNPLVASQHEQAWQQVIALLNDLATVHEDAPFLREELFELIREVLMTETQSTIPGGVDQVFISGYAHAHMWTKPYVFVLGLTERTLPAKVTPHGLLQDEEREMFAHLFGIPLGWTTTERTALNRQLPYMLFTRASEQLTLSYPSMRGGSEVQPSPYYTRLLYAGGAALTPVPDTLNETTGGDGEGAIPVIRPVTALDILVQNLAQVSSREQAEQMLAKPLMRDITGWFYAREDRRSLLARALRGLSHALPHGRLDSSLAKRLYGTPLRTSVHRLETYAACPYRYFIRYGLQAEPLQFDSMQAADVGNLLHDTVYTLVAGQQSGNVNLADLSYDEMMDLAETIFAEQVQLPRHVVFQQRRTGHAKALDLRHYVHAVAETLWLHAKQGAYEPLYLEWSFGMQGDEAKAFALELEDGSQVLIRGRIDRLDVFRDGDTVWYRVMDYKSGANHAIDTTKMYYGLQLQLMVYLAVAEFHLSSMGVPRPAGAFYVPLLSMPGIAEVPVADDVARSLLRKALRPQGYMNADPQAIVAMDKQLPSGGSELFAEVYKQDGEFRKSAKVWTDEAWRGVLEYTVERVKAIAKELASGSIPVRPYLYSHTDRACTHCEFAAVCHFEPTDHAQFYRVLQERKIDDILGEQSEPQGGQEA